MNREKHTVGSQLTSIAAGVALLSAWLGVAPPAWAGSRWMLVYYRQLGNQINSNNRTLENHLFLEDGSKAVGLFNRGAEAATVTVNWTDLGIKGKKAVRDLWRQQDLGKFSDKFEATVPSHGVVLVKIKK